MTIKDFFESFKSFGKFAIHCDTKGKAEKLLKAFDEAGYRWSNGEKYIENTHWSMYHKEMCYANNRMYSPMHYYQNEGIRYSNLRKSTT